MRSKYLLGILLFVIYTTFSQENNSVLFTIDDEPYYTKEFLNVYKKNLKLVVESKSDVVDYLDLFVDYKLKVKQAKELGLDTLQKFKNELRQYKNNLVLPYLRDEAVTKQLIKEAYERLKEEVNVSHILLFLKPDASPQDTIVAYNKLIEARNLVLSGSRFSDIAKKYSKDPSVEQNGGSVGYFTALQMVYSFENVAFNTKLNEVSQPFRTKFGYHILKVNGRRDSKGEVEVAHIMFKNNGQNSKKKIDSIYQLLLKQEISFSNLAKKVSEDRTSAIKGGKLKKFGTGKMIENFTSVAFSLLEKGDISAPFKTQFGWHVIKLLKKYPLKSFDEMEGKIRQEVEKDARANLIGKSVLDKLLKHYNVLVNKQALDQFNKGNWKNNPKKFNKILFSINQKEISQKKFITYLNSVSHTPVKEAFITFKEKTVLDYYKDNIEHSNPEFAVKYSEFKEGLLLFDLLEKYVWEKAKDRVGLLKYFNINKEKIYRGKEFDSIKGNLISDYQNYLDIQFAKQLHKKYVVKINKSEKKRIKKLNF